jgi:hypothetical protein
MKHEVLNAPVDGERNGSVRNFGSSYILGPSAIKSYGGRGASLKPDSDDHG